jgi:hypothetical protein
MHPNVFAAEQHGIWLDLPHRHPDVGQKRPRKSPKNLGRAAAENTCGKGIRKELKVTKWSTQSGDFDVSEQQAEQSNSAGASVVGSTLPDSSDPLIESVMATMRETRAVESPAIAPDHEAPNNNPPKIEVDATRTNAPRKRGFAAMAAVALLAMAAGAIGGGLAATGLNYAADAGEVAAGNPTLEASIARIDAEIVGLKAGLESTTKTGTNQYNKTSDRLDKIEKAQVEPAARLAKLSDAVEKLRAAAPAALAAAPAAGKESTGSITPPNGTAALPVPAAAPAPAASPAPPASPKPEAAHLPTVDGWVLRDVRHGGALIEGRSGLYEVYAGDPVPGLGRIDAIRKQDGHWVVVTSRGLVVSR